MDGLSLVYFLCVLLTAVTIFGLLANYLSEQLQYKLPRAAKIVSNKVRILADAKIFHFLVGKQNKTNKKIVKYIKNAACKLYL